MERDEILRRINDNVLEGIMVSDLISDFSILIQARDIHGKPILNQLTRITKDDVDNTNFPMHEELFKKSWYLLIKKSRETKASDL